MELYLIKSAACLAILLAFYKLFLEKESIHVFKRFYLLVALVIAFGIPLITFTQYIETPVSTIPLLNDNVATPILVDEETTSIINWIAILWIIYGLGVLFFGIRFLLNLLRIVNRIKLNPKHKNKGFINVLLNDLVIPHTFFNYIFLNKLKFENQEIPEEVLLHEHTHAAQKHTLDILFIEILQVVFWFNPLIYLLKRAVKLNHEFLADKAVMNQGGNPTTYQKLLLAFSSSASEPQLANAINYSSIKKRFTVMNTHTSRKTVWLRSFILLPLLAIMVYGFSTERVEQLYSEIEELNPPIELFLDSEGLLFHKGQQIEIENLASIQKLEDDMNISIETSLETDIELIKSVTQSIQHYMRGQGIKRFSVCTNSEGDVKSNLPKKQSASQEKNVIEKVKNELEEAGNLKINYLNEQKSATRKQLAEYNKLAKEYNALLKKKNHSIFLKDVKRLKYIYSIMSEKQREDAEPFPDFPEPPEAPEAPKGVKLDTEFKVLPPPPPPIPDNATPAQKAKYKKVIDNYERTYKRKVHQQKTANGEKINIIAIDDVYNVPPPPPPPKAPPTMEELAEKGAIFYLEGKQITSKKAIEIANTNKDINIQIIGVDSKQPTVKLSKKGITVDR